MINHKKKNYGFSLLETTVAVAVLVMGVVAPLSLASQSIKSAAVSRNDITVANLAEEGLELIKNYRANNLLQGKTWLSDMAFCFDVNGCEIDPVSLNIQACSSSCDFLKFDSSLGLYNYNVGQNSIFKRTIKIINIDPSREVQINVSLSWDDRFGNHNFNLKTSMLDW